MTEHNDERLRELTETGRSVHYTGRPIMTAIAKALGPVCPRCKKDHKQPHCADGREWGPMASEAPALPDLERQCAECEGTGVVYDPEWAEWWKRHQATRLQFEAVAPGEDWYTSHEYRALDRESPDGPEEIECRKCGGTGTVPTAAGRALLSFLSNWGDR